MRRHTIRTTKILAIAITAAGCTSTAGSLPTTSASALAQRAMAEPQPADKHAAEIEKPIAPEPTATVVSVELEAEDPVAADPVAALVLLAELQQSPYFSNGATDYRGAASDARYRALCDAQGYPLVGNVISKSSGTAKASINTLCQQMREDGHIAADTEL